MQVRDVEFLRSATSRPIKMTVPGPFTMSQQAQNDFYETDAELALAYAGAVHDEIADLFTAGADIVQIDEPYMQARPEKAREFGVAALTRALDGIEGTTAVHICFGYAAIIHERPGGVLVPARARRLHVRPHLDRDCRSPTSTRRSSRRSPGRRIILGVIDLDPTRSSRPRSSPPASARRCRTSAPTS